MIIVELKGSSLIYLELILTFIVELRVVKVEFLEELRVYSSPTCLNVHYLLRFVIIVHLNLKY